MLANADIFCFDVARALVAVAEWIYLIDSFR
jgi:hypothetical protein